MRGILKDYYTSPPSRGINLAPLIDVIFQLILFFMVTSSFTWYSGMQVKIPKASTSDVDRPLEAITLEVAIGERTPQAGILELKVKWWEQGVEGLVFYPLRENDDPFRGLTLLMNRLQNYKNSLGSERTPSVIIAAGDNVPYQAVVTVIDMCHTIGLTDIVLAVQKVGQVSVSTSANR